MARCATGLQAVAELQPAPRQALLLRLAAGLEEEEAAAVSGLTLENYREALAQACPRDVQGQVDTTAWRQLAEAIQQHARDLAPERLDRLAQVRESAVSALRPERKVTPLRSAERTVLSQTTAGPRHLGWIVGVVVLCLLALAATWGWPRWQAWRSTPVSYTHLDVYKRQALCSDSSEGVALPNSTGISSALPRTRAKSRAW